ncbi:hypothetical protein ACQ4PT_013981 [Festuca glaucescens]
MVLLLLPPLPPMAHSRIGSAATRPEEDTVIIATSFEIDQDMKDWEATAAITWVISSNRKILPIAIDRAIRKKFQLRHNDLSVCPHQPVQFLLKFVRKEHCSEVLKQGRIKADGALLQLHPWRPLEHAFGASMSYRVMLCLEGVPAYGHTPMRMMRGTFVLLPWLAATDATGARMTTRDTTIPAVMTRTTSRTAMMLSTETDVVLVSTATPKGVSAASARSPRKWDDGANYGHRRDVGPKVQAAATLSHCDLMVPATMSASDMRAVLTEQAALLRAELLACLDGVIRPILAESEALRAWNVKAIAYLDRVTLAAEPLRPPSPPVSSARRASPEHAFIEDAGVTLSPMGASPAVGEHQDAAALDEDTFGRLAQLQITTRNEAWNDDRD